MPADARAMGGAKVTEPPGTEYIRQADHVIRENIVPAVFFACYKVIYIPAELRQRIHDRISIPYQDSAASLRIIFICPVCDYCPVSFSKMGVQDFQCACDVLIS